MDIKKSFRKHPKAWSRKLKTYRVTRGVIPKQNIKILFQILLLKFKRIITSKLNNLKRFRVSNKRVSDDTSGKSDSIKIKKN